MSEISRGLSVLISTYVKERATALQECFGSLLKDQDLISETIVVADGRLTEELYLVIQGVEESLRVKLVQLEDNVGLGLALHHGLNACENDLVARIDSDDMVAKGRLGEQMAFLDDNPEIDVVGSYLEEFNASPSDLGRIKRSPVSHLDIVKYAKYRNPMNHPSVMFRKSAVMKAGGYQHAPLFEDYYLWLRMLNCGSVMANIPKPLTYFRVSPEMMGRRHGWEYMVKEIRFLGRLKTERLITLGQFIKMVALRVPLRLIPKRVFQYFYSIFLRK